MSWKFQLVDQKNKESHRRDIRARVYSLDADADSRDYYRSELTMSLRPRNELDASTIRGIMIKKRDTLRSLDRVIEQLAEKKDAVAKEIVHLHDRLKPHNHHVLPNELLGRVFSLVAQDHGPAIFPILKSRAPPQLAISHVCSHWRRVAFHTSELWNSTQLILSSKNSDYSYSDDVISLHQRWLARAGSFQISLSISFRDCWGIDDYPTGTMQRILLPFQIKKLHLSLTHEDFVELSSLAGTTLSDSTELALDLRVPDGFGWESGDGGDSECISDSHPFLPRLRSITVRCYDDVDGWLNNNFRNIPWSQLRSLEIDALTGKFPMFINILRQIPLLHTFKLKVFYFSFGSVEELIMPSLRDLALEIDDDELENPIDGKTLNNVLRCFTCHSLTDFSLCASPRWSNETFDILKRQYNIQGLHKLKISSGIGLPISCILRNAPLLRSFVIGQDAILDDEAIISISNGTLARSLRSLGIHFKCDPGDVLGMVAMRKKTADGLIKNGCSWREEITLLKKVVVYCIASKHRAEYDERANALREAGITVEFTTCPDIKDVDN